MSFDSARKKDERSEGTNVGHIDLATATARHSSVISNSTASIGASAVTATSPEATSTVGAWRTKARFRFAVLVRHLVDLRWGEVG
jgi:hypothetical protein